MMVGIYNEIIASQKEDKMISCGNCPYLDDCEENDECPFWEDEDDEIIAQGDYQDGQWEKTALSSYYKMVKYLN